MRPLKLYTLTPIITSILILISLPSQSRAHSFPIRSDPRVGWTITTPPPKVTIWFDGDLEPAFSTISVYDSSKQRVDKGNSRVNSSDPTVLEVDLPVLAPGAYRVYWRVLSKDTHVTEGDFTFTITGKSQ
jgi:methionine-rich copper-binding protein CopC